MTLLKNLKTGVAVAAMTLTICAGALAQKVENGLVGVKLFDSGVKVLNLYGNPDQIIAVSIGQQGAGAPRNNGRPGTGGLPGAGGGSGLPPELGVPGEGDFSLGDQILQQRPPGFPPGEGGPGNRPGLPGARPNAPAAGATGAGERTVYTRWVYQRGGSKYSFIIDKFNRVVQIEAVGIQNQKVHTARGVGFGSTFSTIIKKYGPPDAYEINGETIVMRYLVKNNIAFRLARLGKEKPQVVTSVVVAAGKA